MSAKKKGNLGDLLIIAKWWGWLVVAVAWLQRKPVASTNVPPLEANWGKPRGGR